MDPIAQAVTTAGSKAVTQGTAGFLKRVAGPAAEEFGFLLQDKVRLYRFKNQLRMLEKAEKWTAAMGKPASAVPLRLLVPLLEGAALEDEPPLADMWAALLARAATSEGKQAVLPSFPTILRQLSPADAAMLDALARWRPDPLGRDQWGPEVDLLSTLSGLEDRSEVELVLDNLSGLGLIERRPSFFSVIGDDGKKKEMMTTKRAYRLTTLGRHFVVSCSAPDTPPSSQPYVAPAEAVRDEEGPKQPANLQLPPGLSLPEPELLPSRETDTHHVVLLTLGPDVEEIWGAIRRVPAEPDDDVWKRIAESTQHFFSVKNLKPGEPATLQIPKPLPREFTVYQIEPRKLDEESGLIVAGPIWRGVLRSEGTTE